MDQGLLVKRSFELVKKDFGLEEEVNLEPDDHTFEWLELQLTRHINYLLDQDFNQLMNALYRIDIAESQIKEILSLASPGDIALNIARVIIEREKQKVITRQRYQQ